jgi:hypothetical protein
MLRINTVMRNEVTRETAVNKAAMDAARHYTRRGLVLIALRDQNRNGDNIIDHGSGTLLRGASGAVIALTAKHLVADTRSMSVMNPNGPNVRLREAQVTEHATDDVAAIHLEHAEFASRAFELDVIGDERTIAKGAQVVVCGFPKRFSGTDEDTKGPLQRYADMTHFGAVRGCDQRSISVDWRQAEFDDEAAGTLRRFGVQPGLQPLNKPRGISGGAVWLWPETPSGRLVWAPVTRLHIIGMACEYTNGAELAVPVWRWRDWLLGLLA